MPQDGNIELTEEVLQKLPSCRDAPELGAAKDIQGAELQGESSSQRVFSNKIKKDLLVAEFGRISGVLGTRSFQQDPFAAIQVSKRPSNASGNMPSNAVRYCKMHDPIGPKRSEHKCSMGDGYISMSQIDRVTTNMFSTLGMLSTKRYPVIPKAR